MNRRRDDEPWLETGKNLQQYEMEIITKFRGELQKHKTKLEAMVETPFVLAVITLIDHGDASAVIEYLRSEHPLTDYDRQALAFYFEGGKRKKARRGAPYSAAYEAAIIAKRIYKEWKTLNKRLKIPDHGRSDAMKEESARFVVEDYMPHLKADFSTTRDNMERAKNRQK